LDVGLGTLLLPAALMFGAPDAAGSYEKGLFCESVKLIEFVVELVDHGNDAGRTVQQLNRSLSRKACYFSTAPLLRARTVKFERNIGASHAIYSIYRVEVTALAPVKTEVGNLVWPLAQPKVMYTLREARPEYLRDH
jgi:hypothetical protein